MKSSKGAPYAVLVLTLCVVWGGFSAPAYAYIGPAIAFISYLFGPVIAVIAAVAMTIYLPVRIYLKKRKKKAAQAEAVSKSQDNAAEN